MSTQAGLVTIAEFLKLPDPREGHYELRHGEVVLVPPPKSGHEKSQARTMNLLNRLARTRGEARMEMAFQPTPEHEFWRADVGFVRAERDAAVGDDEYLMGAPDVVVEVLSPGNTADEINDRIAVCLANGCSSFWVLDRKRRMLSVTEGDVTHHYREPDTFYCAVIDANVPVRELFD